MKKIPIPVCCLLVLTALPLVADDRSFDGTGNNQLHQDWGAAGTVFQRLGPAQYADGIAALDESDRPIDGFSLNDCVYINTNSVDHTVEWLGKGTDVSALAGRIVKLAVRMRGTDLYALQFKNSSAN